MKWDFSQYSPPFHSVKGTDIFPVIHVQESSAVSISALEETLI